MADRGDLVSAVENLQKAVELNAANPEYHYNLGLALRLKGDMDSSRRQFRRPSGSIPTMPSLIVLWGWCCAKVETYPLRPVELRLAWPASG